MQVHNAAFVTSAVKPNGYPPPTMPEIAFAGRSNVGKSTLINALVGVRKLAKVGQKPGKTRLINFFNIDDRFMLVDLPGYGWAKVSKSEQEAWGRMIETYLGKRDNLACVVILVDLRRGVLEMDRQLIDYLDAVHKPYLLVFTKADKLKGNVRRDQIRAVSREIDLPIEQMLVTSAEKKHGLAAVWEALGKYLPE